MPQTMTYDAGMFLGAESQPTGVGACVHEAVWVVDVASRRVIRRACDVCMFASEPFSTQMDLACPALAGGAFRTYATSSRK